MNDFEARVASTLRAEREAAGSPPADLGARIHRGVKSRQAVRRRFAIAATALTAAALGLVITVVVVVAPPPVTPADGGGSAPTTSPAPTSGKVGERLGRSISSSAAPLPDGLAQVLGGDPAQTFTFGADTQNGVFRALSLSDDGTVAGVDDMNDGWTKLRVLWSADERVLDGAKPELIALGDPLAGARVLVWTAPDLMAHCADPRTGSERLLGFGVASSGGHLVWSDLSDGEENPAVMVSEGCGTGQPTGAHGKVVGFAYPMVYVLDASGHIAVFDVTRPNGRPDPGPEASPADVVPPAAAVPPNSAYLPAAGPGVTAWFAADQFMVVDANGVRTRQFAPSPGANGTTIKITIGTRLVVISGAPIDGDWSDSEALIYDRRSQSWTELAGTAWAAGGWLAWQQENTVSVFHVPPTS